MLDWQQNVITIDTASASAAAVPAGVHAGVDATAPEPGSREHAVGILAQANEAYRLAHHDRPRESNQPHGFSGDAAIMGSHDLMNRRTRDLQRNTAQTKRIISVLTNLIVGSGMQTFSWPFSATDSFEMKAELESIGSDDLGPRLTFAMESDELFEEWSTDKDQFDVEGRLTWPEAQRMLIGESALVGNGFLVRSFVKDYSLVPLAYQIIEREQLDQSHDRPASKGKNKIVGGLELNRHNRVVAYHFYTDHPHEMFGSPQSGLFGAGAGLSAGSGQQRIPAERVIDLCLFTRPSAALGATWLDACGQSIDDRDSYMGSEITSAAIDAVFAYVAKLKDADKSGAMGLDDGGGDTDEYGNRQFKMGRSPMAAVIGTDEELDMIRPTRPNKDAKSFIHLLDGDIAAAVGISIYSLTGDYSDANFSSTRGSKLDEDLTMKPLQQWFALRAALRVRRDFNAMAASVGLFKSVTPAEFRRNQRTYQRFDWVGAGRDLLDPYKEGEARTTRLRTGMSTYKEECARVGKHWIRELQQIATERTVARGMDVELDFSKSGSGKEKAESGKRKAENSTQKTDDEQAENIAERVALHLEERD